MNLKTAKITVNAFAKLNLFLNITGTLENGYHSLETVMQTIDLADKVTVETSGSGIRISCDNPLVPCNEKNIAYRAAKAFMTALSEDFGVKITIEKRIPLEAGMGGSSTDGAAVLLALNRLCGNPFEMHELLKLGARLGADVPFCLCGGTKICRGTGDVFEKTQPVPDCTFLIIKPDFAKNTTEAYKLFDIRYVESKPDFISFCDAMRSGSISEISSRLYNVFSELYADERIFSIERTLIASGALGAAMTGSGSAVFGIFSSEEKAKIAQNSISFPMKYLSKPINALEIAEKIW